MVLWTGSLGVSPASPRAAVQRSAVRLPAALTLNRARLCTVMYRLSRASRLRVPHWSPRPGRRPRRRPHAPPLQQAQRPCSSRQSTSRGGRSSVWDPTSVPTRRHSRCRLARVVRATSRPLTPAAPPGRGTPNFVRAVPTVRVHSTLRWTTHSRDCRRGTATPSSAAAPTAHPPNSGWRTGTTCLWCSRASSCGGRHTRRSAGPATCCAGSRRRARCLRPTRPISGSASSGPTRYQTCGVGDVQGTLRSPARVDVTVLSALRSRRFSSLDVATASRSRGLPPVKYEAHFVQVQLTLLYLL